MATSPPMSKPPLLLIRKEQIEAFDRDRPRRFEARLIHARADGSPGTLTK
jgi:hypothetical protein